MSGATITIAKDDTVENAERNIKISGTKDQISHALELINRAIAESKYKISHVTICRSINYHMSPLVEV